MNVRNCGLIVVLILCLYTFVQRYEVALASAAQSPAAAQEQIYLEQEPAGPMIPTVANPPSVFMHQETVAANDGFAGDFFGSNVAVDGDTAVVGSYRYLYEADGGEPNAVYIFVRSANGWIEQQKLVADETSQSQLDEGFGHAVAVQDDIIFVSAPGFSSEGNAGNGAVYIFTRSGDRWEQQQKLTVEPPLSTISLGISIAVDGDTLLVGAEGTVQYSHREYLGQLGEVYVFKKNGEIWEQQQKLMPPDRITSAFGWSVALDGGTALVGEPTYTYGYEYTDRNELGTVFFYEERDGTWHEQQQLQPGDGESHHRFGYNLALDGNTAAISAEAAHVEGEQNPGAVYMFNYDESSWQESQKLAIENGQDESIFYTERFGEQIALQDETLLVSHLIHFSDYVDLGFVHHGEVHLFRYSGATWQRQQTLTASDSWSNAFGTSIAIDNETILISEYAAIGEYTHPGSVDFFQRRLLSASRVFLPTVAR